MTEVLGRSGIHFKVEQWAAWAPGVTTAEAWKAWASAPFAPSGPDVPSLSEVPPMARRRIERLGRLAYQVAAECQGASRGAPLVFASRHGDVARSIELLGELADGAPVSPAGFGLSVHNAIAGQYTITRKDSTNAVSVAGGRFTAEAAAVEAHGLLAEGHPEVVVVVYDVGLPPLYQDFVDEPQADFAWAVRLARPAEGDAAIELEQGPSPGAAATDAAATDAALPHGLEVLAFLLGGKTELSSAGPTGQWVWTKHG